jgi:hypothetical protein
MNLSAQLFSNHFYLEFECVLEVSGDKVLVGVHLDPVPAGVGNHNGGDTLIHGVLVRWHVDVHQALAADDVVVLVDAVHRAAVAYKVLRQAATLFLHSTQKLYKQVKYVLP